MKAAICVALLLLVVPIQIAWLDRISIAGVGPDLALVAVCLIGLVRNDMETVLAGLAMGFAQDLFSGGALWSNLCLKPMLGLLAGVARRNLATLTWAVVLTILAGLSLLSGSLTGLLKSVTGPGLTVFSSVSGILVPQACYDTILGLAAWTLIRRGQPRRASMTTVAP